MRPMTPLLLLTLLAAAPATDFSAELKQLERSVNVIERAILEPGRPMPPDAVATLRRACELAPHAKAAPPGTARRYTALLAALDDEPTVAALRSSNTPSDRAILLHARWLRAGEDDAARDRILTDYQTLARDNPANDDLAQTLYHMLRGRLKNQTFARVLAILRDDLHGTNASRDIRRREANAAKLAALAGQPLTLTGTTSDGRPFSTADWKGKVVLVDFTATWCGPCMAEIPRLKQLYSTHHANGLEIVAVSCDAALADLNAFLSKNPDVAWPHLFDPAAPNGWHPLATQLGIDAIPVMILIDKAGTVRSTTARGSLQTLIPQLLAE